jgi:hypothetical protein
MWLRELVKQLLTQRSSTLATLVAVYLAVWLRLQRKAVSPGWAWLPVLTE